MIPEIHKILFTSDLSETSKHAFSYALSIAGRYQAKMVFLYVMEEVRQNIQAFIDMETVNPVRHQMAANARDALIGKRSELGTLRSGLQQFVNEAVEDLEKAGDVVTTGDVIVAEGNVVDTIIRTAREQKCDAIVLGAKRHGALAELMLGSVVRGVLRRADCMVVIAPPLEPPKK